MAVDTLLAVYGIARSFDDLPPLAANPGLTDPHPREVLLRTASRWSPAMSLSAWRGRSGRRYVVGIHEAATVDADDLIDAVLIAVSRDKKGIAQAERVAACTDLTSVRAFIGALPKDATEIHVHRLAEDDSSRAGIVADLKPEA